MKVTEKSFWDRATNADQIFNDDKQLLFYSYFFYAAPAFYSIFVQVRIEVCQAYPPPLTEFLISSQKMRYFSTQAAAQLSPSDTRC
jgi:hypothetical protein